MKSVIAFLALTCTLVTAATTAAADSDFKPLFNGRNLDGWYTSIDRDGKKGPQDIFTVSNGVIHAYASHAHGSEQPYGGLITKESFSRYHLSLEYKWGEKKFIPRHDFVRDAGVIVHMLLPDTLWPNGVECQIQEGDTGDIWVIGTKVTSRVQSVIRNYSPNGDLVTRGNPNQRFHRFHRSYNWEKPGWNRLDLIVDGDHAVFKVNGRVVNEVIEMRQWNAETQKWTPLTEGPILLQAEGAEVLYRDIKIKPLD